MAFIGILIITKPGGLLDNGEPCTETPDKKVLSSVDSNPHFGDKQSGIAFELLKDDFQTVENENALHQTHSSKTHSRVKRAFGALGIYFPRLFKG
ncbi:unnamed protein product [Orchesella dallaii]|uniref:Uncharacterized protein n=1 Tax=Orchesella dallaii TaxID=48710 RepID=A0ABP1RKY5_9HEXA